MIVSDSTNISSGSMMIDIIIHTYTFWTDKLKVLQKISDEQGVVHEEENENCNQWKMKWLKNGDLH